MRRWHPMPRRPAHRARTACPISRPFSPGSTRLSTRRILFPQRTRERRRSSNLRGGFYFTNVQRSHRAEVTMSTRQNDPVTAPRSRFRSPAAIVLILFIMVSGYFWGRQFNARDIAQRDAAIQQLQSDGQRLAADIADQNANLTALRAELTSTKAALDAIMPSQNTYNIN